MVQWDWSPARSGTTWELHPAGSLDHDDDDNADYLDYGGDEYGHVTDDLGYLYLVDALSWMFEMNVLNSLQINTQ